ncbi:MAG: DUF2249 domain-containing protein [Elusimicrobia bacterium]|nr:DUF2249 domain-containing protein [Elusimicrobiota bacterium]
MNKDGVIMLKPQKPRWWRVQPEITLNGQVTNAISPIQTIIKAAEQLSSGQTLSIRLGYEPELLYHILGEKGFDHWSEPQENGVWRIDFCRLPARRA